MAVLGNEFTIKQLRELYIANGCSAKSCEMKILRLKRDGKIKSIARGKYRLVK